MKQNITISFDKDLIQTSKMIAAQRETLLNWMFCLELERIIRNARQYDYGEAKGHRRDEEGISFRHGSVPFQG